MQWRGQRESSNVEDRRGQGGLGNLGGLGTRRGGGIGIGTIVVALVLSWLLGINPLTLLGMFSGADLGGMSTSQVESPLQRSPAGQAADDDASRFVRVVLASTEEVWSPKFKASNSRYPAPQLVLFTGATPTGCGTGNAAAGPFYCPADQKVYIDLSFFTMMHQKLGAPGDFAQAYVIAHEIGHHIQNVTGTMKKLEQLRSQLPRDKHNELSVRLELQADCYAGIWARDSQQAKNWLEHGDIEEAINAAAKVGDDNMMRQAGAPVRTEHFTHGSSRQRVQWFNAGLRDGRIAACDTFSGAII